MLMLRDNSSLFPFHSWGNRRLGRGKTGFIGLFLFLLLVVLCFWQSWCFLDIDFQPLVLKNSTKVWELCFLLFLIRGKMVW